METPCFDKHFGLVDLDAATQVYTRGQTVYRRGDLITGVYCIKSGSVAVYTRSHDGHDLQLYVAECGELLGVPEIMGFERFNCTAVSTTASTLCFISRLAFNEFINHRPERAVALMSHICRRIEQLESIG